MMNDLDHSVGSPIFLRHNATDFLQVRGKDTPHWIGGARRLRCVVLPPPLARSRQIAIRWCMLPSLDPTIGNRSRSAGGLDVSRKFKNTIRYACLP
ncbi:unnamed protein product, partial [Musa hybrid cultivar]